MLSSEAVFSTVATVDQRLTAAAKSGWKLGRHVAHVPTSNVERGGFVALLTLAKISTKLISSDREISTFIVRYDLVSVTAMATL